MHTEQILFCRAIRQKFPEFFINKRVLDVGSLDINGSNKCLFTNCRYMGIDLQPGKNVDYVCHVASMSGGAYYDTIISTEAFEHDQRWETSILNIAYKLLAPGGLFVFTCATAPRPEHGTNRTDTESSPFTT